MGWIKDSIKCLSACSIRMKVKCKSSCCSSDCMLEESPYKLPRISSVESTGKIESVIVDKGKKVSAV